MMSLPYTSRISLQRAEGNIFLSPLPSLLYCTSSSPKIYIKKIPEPLFIAVFDRDDPASPTVFHKNRVGGLKMTTEKCPAEIHLPQRVREEGVGSFIHS